MLLNTTHFFSKLCQNNFAIYFAATFLGRRFLEHVKSGSSVVEEKQEERLLNATQHMESHLHLAQAPGKEQEKSQKFTPNFSRKQLLMRQP